MSNQQKDEVIDSLRFDNDKKRKNDDQISELRKYNLRTVFGSGKGRVALLVFMFAIVVMFVMGVGYKAIATKPSQNDNKRALEMEMGNPGEGDGLVTSNQEANMRMQDADRGAASAKASGGTFLSPPVVVASGPDYAVIDKKTGPQIMPPEHASSSGVIVTQFDRDKADAEAKEKAIRGELNTKPAMSEDLSGKKDEYIKNIQPQIYVVMGKNSDGSNPDPVFVTRTFATPDRSKTNGGQGQVITSAAPAAPQQSETGKCTKPLYGAGDAVYARLKYGANSDTGTKIAVAQLLQGPHAGANLVGAPEFTDEDVGISFTRFSIPGKASINVKAVAINEETLLTGLADDVNHHYVRRFGAVFVASLLKGLGKAAAIIPGSVTTTTTSTTTTTAQPTQKQQVKIALGEVGDQVGAAIQKSNEGLKNTVLSNPGKTIGVVFLEDVCN